MARGLQRMGTATDLVQSSDITHKSELHLSDLQSRLFLAESKVSHFQAKYGKA